MCLRRVTKLAFPPIIFLILAGAYAHQLTLFTCYPFRLVTLVLTVLILNSVHHSPLLAVCAVLTGAAAYLQATYVGYIIILCMGTNEMMRVQYLYVY